MVYTFSRAEGVWNMTLMVDGGESVQFIYKRQLLDRE
jgi:hypothetical protein